MPISHTPHQTSTSFNKTNLKGAIPVRPAHAAHLACFFVFHLLQHGDCCGCQLTGQIGGLFAFDANKATSI